MNNNSKYLVNQILTLQPEPSLKTMNFLPKKNNQIRKK